MQRLCTSNKFQAGFRLRVDFDRDMQEVFQRSLLASARSITIRRDLNSLSAFLSKHLSGILNAQNNDFDRNADVCLKALTRGRTNHFSTKNATNDQPNTLAANI